jgi:hypothetical protein
VRTIKIVAGLCCFVAALFPGLLMMAYFNWPLAICALGLAGAGYFLITRRNSPMKKTKVLIVPFVCILIGFVIVIVIPNFVRATHETAQNECINNLRQIDGAKQEWALETGKTNGIVTENDIKPYLINGKLPKCPTGGTYIIGNVGEEPKCSIGTSAWPNSHVLSGGEVKDNWWTDFKAAYSIVFALRPAQPPPK